MGPKANNLFHFTRSLTSLQGILSGGFLPRYSLEDARHMADDLYVAYPMTCFCDIPISRIADHTAFYGEYGLGMTKEWGLKNGLAPLLYTPPQSAVTKLIDYLLSIHLTDADGKSTSVQEQLNQHFSRLAPMIKPLSGYTVAAGTLVEKEFYQENEWRYVPHEHEIVFREDFEKQRDRLNDEIASKRLEFSPHDVKYIFVKSDSEIPIVFDFIQMQLGHFPHNDIKILTTRITSLETIAKDL
jgi:hypothetical protein